MVFRGGRAVALIDFDDACPGFLVSDLAVMLAGWATDRQTHALLPDRAAHLLNAYNALRPLTPAERDLLPDFLLLFGISDDCATVLSALREDTSTNDAVAECTRSLAFLDQATSPAWRTALTAW